MNRRVVRGSSVWMLCVSLVAVLAVDTADARQLGLGKLFGRGAPKGVAFTAYKDPNARFTLEYPEKDWRIMPTPGSSLLIVAQKDFEATFVVDYKKLEAVLGPADVTDAFIEIETEAIKERQRSAKDINAEIVDAPAGRGALFKYTITGLRGPERMIQFSLPSGQNLFRLIGSMREPLAAKYEPIVSHSIESFRPAAEAKP